MTPPATPPPPRKRLSSAELPEELSGTATARLARELLERIEGLEETAAKGGDVRELAGKFDTFREQSTERDAQLFSAIARFEQAQRAAVPSAWGARFWGKVAAMGSVAGPALVIAFAQWGVAHPEAFSGLAGVIGAAILGVARATTPGAHPSQPPGPPS